MTEYRNRPTLDKLEPYYSRHISAMTTENLWSKSDIAAELAVRDKRIAELETAARLLTDQMDAVSRPEGMGRAVVLGELHIEKRALESLLTRRGPSLLRPAAKIAPPSEPQRMTPELRRTLDALKEPPTRGRLPGEAPEGGGQGAAQLDGHRPGWR